jgi:hypothetical protein
VWRLCSVYVGKVVALHDPLSCTYPGRDNVKNWLGGLPITQVDSQSYGGGNTLDGAIGPVLDSRLVGHRAAIS